MAAPMEMETGASPPAPPPSTTPIPETAEMTETTNTTALDADAGPSEGSPPPPKMVTPKVSSELLRQLEAMGFGTHRAVRALYSSKSQGIPQCLAWLEKHQGDTKMDCPLLVPAAEVSMGASSSLGKKRSWKCVETGRLFTSMKAVQLYAERSGRSNFEESTDQVTPMTEEERKAKVDALRVTLKKRAVAKKRAEAKASIEREKVRRLEGKATRSMAEEGARMQRLRDAKERKKEKIDAARALARAKKLWAIQEAEKAAARALARGEKPDAARAAAAIQGKSFKKRHVEPPLVRVEASLKVLGSYSAGGEGLRAMKLLRIYLKNALTKDEKDPKFRRINLGNKHYVARVKGLRGGSALLSASGFERQDACDKWPAGSYFLPLPIDRERLGASLAAVEVAIKAMA